MRLTSETRPVQERGRGLPRNVAPDKLTKLSPPWRQSTQAPTPSPKMASVAHLDSRDMSTGKGRFASGLVWTRREITRPLPKRHHPGLCTRGQSASSHSPRYPFVLFLAEDSTIAAGHERIGKEESDDASAALPEVLALFGPLCWRRHATARAPAPGPFGLARPHSRHLSPFWVQIFHDLIHPLDPHTGFAMNTNRDELTTAPSFLTQMRCHGLICARSETKYLDGARVSQAQHHMRGNGNIKNSGV